MRHRARRQSSPRVIRVGRAFRRIVGLIDLRQPALDIVLVGQPQRARAAVGRRIARRIVGEVARRPARGRHLGQPVRRRRIGVGRNHPVQRLARAVAVGVVEPADRAVIALRRSEAACRRVGEILRLLVPDERRRIAGILVVGDGQRQIARPGQRPVEPGADKPSASSASSSRALVPSRLQYSPRCVGGYF